MAQPTVPLGVVIAASLWGTTGTVAHFLTDFSPLLIGAVTMGVGGVLLAIISGRDGFAVWAGPAFRLWWLIGAGCVAVYPLAFYSGMELAGVAVGNIIALGIGPLVGAGLEWLVDKQRPATIWWWAVLFGTSGVLALSGADLSATTADPDRLVRGIALAIVAGVSYGGFSYAMARLMRQGATALGSAGAVFGLGAVPLLGVLIVTGAPLLNGGGQLWGLSYLVLGPMVLSYVLYSRALASLASSRVLLIALVEPVVATLLAVLIVGERFGVLGAVGIGLVMVSVFLVVRPATMRLPAE